MSVFTVPLEEDPLVFAIHEFNLSNERCPTREEIFEELGTLENVEFRSTLERMLVRSYRVKSGFGKIGNAIIPTIELTVDGRVRAKYLHKLYLQVQSHIREILNHVKKHSTEYPFVSESMLERRFPSVDPLILWHLGYLNRVGRETEEIDPYSYDKKIEFGYNITAKGERFLEKN